MAEKKTKQDIEEKRAEKVAKKTSVKTAKAKSAETQVKTDNIKAKQDDIAAKSEVADMTDEQVKADADSGTAIVAKAGKRSSKGIKEAEEKQSKLERQQSDAASDDAASKPKTPIKAARPKIERKGKKYQEVAKLIEKDKEYALSPAVSLLPKIATSKFDATAELHIRLNVDPKQADQNIRGTIVLPAGTGKDVRVAVFADNDDVSAAKKAGADIAGSEDFLAQLDKGTINFDVLIAKPQVMAKLSKYARVLGPKGLMPNPKSGTVTNDIEKAVKEAKAGRVEYRVDEAGIIHVAFGKMSFGNEKLLENLKTLLTNIKNSKPSSVKGSFIQGAFLSPTMGPSIKLDINEINSL
jgi:ribosomal protein L1